VDQKKVWTTHLFDCYKTNEVESFFKELVKEGILSRSRVQNGRQSGAVLVNSRKLLALCVKGFADNIMARLAYTSKRSHPEVVKDLQWLETDYYISESDAILTILIPESSWFTGTKQNELQKILGINKVQSGGDIEIILPRYHDFLEKYHRIENGVKVPSDFYTYLTMKSSHDPVVQQKAKQMETLLKTTQGSFLYGKPEK
jgi:hypothetical protein